MLHGITITNWQHKSKFVEKKIGQQNVANKTFGRTNNLGLKNCNFGKIYLFCHKIDKDCVANA